jgi:hypothetical protein
MPYALCWTKSLIVQRVTVRGIKAGFLYWQAIWSGELQCHLSLRNDWVAQYNLGSLLEKVNYVIDLPDLDPYKNDPSSGDAVRAQIFTKTDNWNYEKEYRFLVIPKLLGNPLSKRTLNFPDDAIQVVILGRKMPPKSKKDIGSILARINPQIGIVDKSRASL